MKRGDRVKLKGRTPQGTVLRMAGIEKKDMWAHVDWDEGKEGPKYVAELELDIIRKARV